MIRRSLLAGLAVPAVLAAFSAVASGVFLWGMGGWDAVPWPERAYAWAEYAPNWGADDVVDLWLGRGLQAGLGAVALGAALLGAAGARGRPSLRFRARKGVRKGASETFGDARWAEPWEIKDRYPGPHKVYGGVAIGELYDPTKQRGKHYHPRNPRTWGPGGQAPLIIDDLTRGSGQTFRVSGSGGGKTQWAMCSLWTFYGSALVLDPKGKIGARTRPWRRRMGHKVITIKPGRPGLNIFDAIDPAHPNAALHIRNLASNMCKDPPREGSERQQAEAQFYHDKAVAVVSTLIGEIIYNPQIPDKSPRTLRLMQARPAEDLRALLLDIHARSPREWIRQAAGGVVTDPRSGELWGNIHGSVDRKLEWLSYEPLAEMVSGGEVRASDILTGRSTIYVEVDFETLQSTPQAPRAVLGAFMGQVMRHGREDEKVLGIVDEAKSFGAMPEIQLALNAGRQSGLAMILLYLSWSDVEEVWGEKTAMSFFNSASSVVFSGINDPDGRELVSRLCGERTLLNYSESRSVSGSGALGASARAGSGRTYSFAETGARLISPHNVGTLRADAQIVVTLEHHAMLTGACFAYRRKEMQEASR